MVWTIRLTTFRNKQRGNSKPVSFFPSKGEIYAYTEIGEFYRSILFPPHWMQRVRFHPVPDFRVGWGFYAGKLYAQHRDSNPDLPIRSPARYLFATAAEHMCTAIVVLIHDLFAELDLFTIRPSDLIYYRQIKTYQILAIYSYIYTIRRVRVLFRIFSIAVIYITRVWFCLLKLYCRYEYTKPLMINRIWGLKQLWLQVNGHAWFHLQRLRWPVRNGEGAKNSKWKYMSPAGFEPTPRQSRQESQRRLRLLGYECLSWSVV